MKDPCPSSGVWQSLLNGTLDEEQSGWLAEHLDTCAGCRELLDRLAGQGTTTLAFAEELPASSQSSAELARLLAELKGQAPGGDVARWDIRPFLKPATRPWNRLQAPVSMNCLTKRRSGRPLQRHRLN